MLAYVFWHWRYPYSQPSAYNERLIDFHQTLCANKPAGFHYSAVFKFEEAPWTGADTEAYEDWYIVENSAGLDPLDEAAVSSVRKQPHDAIAQAAAGGCGGLYRLRMSTPAFATTRCVQWFAKPPDMTYTAMYATLETIIKATGGCLWQRQMVLGPAPEFCLHTAHSEDLPTPFVALKIPLTPVWSA